MAINIINSKHKKIFHELTRSQQQVFL